MESGTPAVIVRLLSELILTHSPQVTELVPPSPPLEQSSFHEIISQPPIVEGNLFYKHAEKSFNALAMQDFRHVEENKNSALMRYAMDYLNEEVRGLEEKLCTRLQSVYKEKIDEVDQATFKQLHYFGKWLVGSCKPFISHHLVEGNFIKLNQAGDYLQAVQFAFHQYWSIKQFLLAHQLYGLQLNQASSLPVLVNEIQHISRKVKEKSHQLKIWQERLRNARKMAEKMFYLKQHQIIWHALLKDCDPDSLEEFIDKQATTRYFYLLNELKVADAISELEASYFNFLLLSRQQSVFSWLFEAGLNYVSTKLASLTTPVTEARAWPFLNKEIKGTYSSLPSAIVPFQELDILETFNSYVEAIEKDQLIYAKWLSHTLTHRLGKEEWQQEEEDLENYSRYILRLVKTSKIANGMIENLTLLQEGLYTQAMEEPLIGNDKNFYSSFSSLSPFINKIFLSVRKIDTLRILLRQGYLKKAKAFINKMEKTYIERLYESAQNKTKRYLLEGIVWDSTKIYETVVQEDLTPFSRAFKKLIDEYEEIIGLARGGKTAYSVRKKYLRLTMQENYYPVFSNLLSGISFMQEEKDFLYGINVFIYNLSHHLNLPFLPKKHIRKFIEQIHQLQRIKGEWADFYLEGKKASRPYEEEVKNQGVTYQDNCLNMAKGLYKSFEKYAITTLNTHSPLTIKRVTESLVRKTIRLWTENALFDSQLEYPSLMKEMGIEINEMENSLREAKQLLALKPAIRSISPSEKILGDFVILDYFEKSKN